MSVIFLLHHTLSVSKMAFFVFFSKKNAFCPQKPSEEEKKTSASVFFGEATKGDRHEVPKKDLDSEVVR